jgi:hypothetical protein
LHFTDESCYIYPISTLFPLHPLVVLEDELEALSPLQRAKWINIQKGVVTKQDVEIVLARYNEDVSWCDQYKSLVTIYNKGEDDLKYDSLPLPNVGREGHTYLHHVVQNYENLADWTVFSQASEPTWGYAAGEDGGHMMSSTSFHDYVLEEGAESKFVFTSVMNISSLAHNIRTSFLVNNDIPRPVSSCPAWSGSDTWGTWIDLGFFKSLLSELQVSQSEGKKPLSPSEYWKKYVGEIPEDKLVYFAQGAIFALSKEQILSRSKQHYETLLAEGKQATSAAQESASAVLLIIPPAPLSPTSLLPSLFSVQLLRPLPELLQ